MKYLITTTEVYRVDTEAEAQELINEAKQDNYFTLSKYTSEYKERKAKGEVIDDYYKVSLTKTFSDIKEPGLQITISYEV
jgi:hypothetical protein